MKQLLSSISGSVNVGQERRRSLKVDGEERLKIHRPNKGVPSYATAKHNMISGLEKDKEVL